VVYRRQLHDADDVLLLDVDPIHPTVQFPPGTIVMFKGSEEDRDEAYPPSLWELCDGDNGTPDTRDRFPVGVSNTKPISGDDSTGGSTSGSVTTSEDGAHTHGGATGSTELSVSQIPAHAHHVMRDTLVGSDTWTNNDHAVAGESSAGGDTEYDLAPTNTGTWRGNSESIGGGQGHTHSISSGGGHTHTVSGIQPPYFTVWYLMRKAS
jgi:microcystin-dependent protein